MNQDKLENLVRGGEQTVFSASIVLICATLGLLTVIVGLIAGCMQ